MMPRMTMPGLFALCSWMLRPGTKKASSSRSDNPELTHAFTRRRNQRDRHVDAALLALLRRDDDVVARGGFGRGLAERGQGSAGDQPGECGARNDHISSL
jgi:hypothetical protein